MPQRVSQSTWKSLGSQGRGCRGCRVLIHPSIFHCGRGASQGESLLGPGRAGWGGRRGPGPKGAGVVWPGTAGEVTPYHTTPTPTPASPYPLPRLQRRQRPLSFRRSGGSPGEVKTRQPGRAKLPPGQQISKANSFLGS